MTNTEASLMPLNTLVTLLMTKSRVLELLTVLEDLTSVQQYNTVFDFQSYLVKLEDSTPYIKDSLCLILKGKTSDCQISTLSANDFIALQNVAESLKSLDYVKVTFAVDPSVAFLSSLYPHFQEIFGDACLDAEVDPLILGGCIFTYKGIYKDFSLRSSLDAYFNSRPQYVNQLLNK